MSLTKKSGRKNNLPEFNVNITALMDILTVLLFFLVKSFTVSSSTLTPPDDVKLPEAIVQENAKEAITVSVSVNEVRFNNEVIIRLKNGRYPQAILGSDKRTLLPLFKLLDAEDKKRKEIYKQLANDEFFPSGKILIQADQKLPFRILKFVLHTAAITGYKDYQFLVVSKNQS
jgi:biopolymer transport protein ExbD